MTLEGWADKDVLILSPAPVFPRDFGNRQRIGRICDLLQEAGARLHFVLYPAEADWRLRLPQAAMQAHVAAFESFHVVPVTRGLHTGAAGTHHTRDEWWDPAIGAFLDWLTRVQRFDAAIVNYTWLSRALTHLPPGCLKILDTHDQFSHRKELFLAQGLEPEFFYMQPAEEAAALDRADVVWAIKREEAEFFRELTDKPVISLPHMGARADLDTAKGEFLRVGLFGASNNLNRENFERFLDAAVAHVRAHLTQVEIVVAGSVCKVLKPRPEGFIRLIGYVDQPEDFYRAVDVVAVPMQFSTGLKIKTAEALAFGKPILALAHAFEGFNPLHPWHVLGTPEEMLAAIETLVRDPAALADLSAASRHAAAVTEAEVMGGLAETIALQAPVRVPTFWLTLNAGECRRQPVLVDQVLGVAEYLSRQVAALGFVFTGGEVPDDELCATLGWHGVLVMEDTGGLEASGLPPRLVLASRAAIRAGASGVWLATRHAVELCEGMPPATVIVGGDALAVSLADDPDARDADLPALLARVGRGQVFTATELSADVAGQIAALGWEVFLLPFLRTNASSPLLAKLREKAERLAAEDLPPPAPLVGAGPRARLDALAAGLALLSRAAAEGPAMTYRLTDAGVEPLVLEYLLRAGSVISREGGALTHEDLDQALRHNAGWSVFWHYALTIAGPVPPEPAPPQAAPEGEVETAGEVSAVAESPAAAPAIPRLGFSRVPGSETPSGLEARFAQMQVYRPTGMALDALDVLFLDASLAGHAFTRLALRFFFVEQATNVFVRRNDCSADVFGDAASVWQEDDWGPFVIYKLGPVLASAYKPGLAGADTALLIEALSLVARADPALAPRLSGEVLDRWVKVMAALSTCDLAAAALEPPPAPAEPEGAETQT